MKSAEDVAKYISEELMLEPFDAEESERNMEFLGEMIEKLRAEGYAAAIEEAAKIADDPEYLSRKTIASEIRALLPSAG